MAKKKAAKKIEKEREKPNVYFMLPQSKRVRGPDGKLTKVPEGWAHLSPGDVGLTRRVKAAGDHFVVKEKKGKRVISRGVWASAATIARIMVELETERSTEAYAKRKVAYANRREKVQAAYVDDFEQAVLGYLKFHPRHAKLAERMARAVAEQSTPVGSGTVARTKRIPIEKRADAAVIAWMRHQTTEYDTMEVPLRMGARAKVRRLLARQSKALLVRYRAGEPIEENCPLAKALAPLEVNGIEG